MTNWKPEEGDWVITRSWNGVDDYTESLCIYHEGHGQSVMRKATLDDFAVEIEGYGKVWACQYKKSIILFFEKEEDGILFNSGNHVQKALSEAFVKANNMVLMPRELWIKSTKLSTWKSF